MNADDIRRGLDQVARQHGDWTAHNIYLGDGVYTIAPGRGDVKLRRVVQIVSDLAGRPLDGLRVLDLGCLEGQYAIEFARHGAQVVAIEGREANLAKARFAKDVLSLNNLELVLDDVRNLSESRYGQFDVVLCLGLLYHLNAPDVFEFVERIAEVCRRLTVFDTHVNIRDKECFPYKGRKYWGASYVEHAEQATREEKLKDLWASLDNLRSVWPTGPSLLNLLNHVGYSSVYECHNPSEPGKPADRLTLVAVKGQPQRLHSAPSMSGVTAEDWPERDTGGINPMQRPMHQALKRVSGLVPAGVKKSLKRALRKVGLMRAPKAPWDWDQPWRSRQADAPAATPPASAK